jgi:hypothetical protein
MGAQRTWTNLLFLILRQITQTATDKPRSSKTKNPNLPLIRAGREIRGQNFFRSPILQIPLSPVPVMKFKGGSKKVISPHVPQTWDTHFVASNIHLTPEKIPKLHESLIKINLQYHQKTTLPPPQSPPEIKFINHSP